MDGNSSPQCRRPSFAPCSRRSALLAPPCRLRNHISWLSWTVDCFVVPTTVVYLGDFLYLILLHCESLEVRNSDLFICKGNGGRPPLRHGNFLQLLSIVPLHPAFLVWLWLTSLRMVRYPSVVDSNSSFSSGIPTFDYWFNSKCLNFNFNLFCYLNHTLQCHLTWLARKDAI